MPCPTVLELCLVESDAKQLLKLLNCVWSVSVSHKNCPDAFSPLCEQSLTLSLLGRGVVFIASNFNFIFLLLAPQCRPSIIHLETRRYMGYVIVKLSRFILLETRGPGVFSINQSWDPCRWGSRSKSWTLTQQAVQGSKYTPSPLRAGGEEKRRGGGWTKSTQRNNTGSSRSSLKACSVWIP